MRSVSVAVVVALCVLAAACDEGDPGIVQPTVHPATVTDTFTGNVTQIPRTRTPLSSRSAEKSTSH